MYICWQLTDLVQALSLCSPRHELGEFDSVQICFQDGSRTWLTSWCWLPPGSSVEAVSLEFTPCGQSTWLVGLLSVWYLGSERVYSKQSKRVMVGQKGRTQWTDLWSLSLLYTGITPKLVSRPSVGGNYTRDWIPEDVAHWGHPSSNSSSDTYWLWSE